MNIAGQLTHWLRFLTIRLAFAPTKRVEANLPAQSQSPLWNWLVHPANAPTVGALGLLISIAGFIFTIVQISRTRSALQASEEATRALRLRLAVTATIEYVTQLEGYIRAAKRELEIEDWKRASEGLGMLRNVLGVLYRRTQHISSEFRDAIPPYSADFAAFASYLASPPRSGIGRKKIGDIDQRLNDFAGFTMRLADHISERIE